MERGEDLLHELTRIGRLAPQLHVVGFQTRHIHGVVDELLQVLRLFVGHFEQLGAAGDRLIGEDKSEVVAARMEVSGVLNSCAMASMMVVRSCSLRRAASTWWARSCARARSSPMAMRLLMPCKTESCMNAPWIAKLAMGSEPRRTAVITRLWSASK